MFRAAVFHLRRAAATHISVPATTSHAGCVRSMAAVSGSSHDPSLSPEENLMAVLKRLHLKSLPPAPPLGGLYVPVVRTGVYLYVSGQPPLDAEGKKITGVCVGPQDVADGKHAALWNGLTMLATIKVRAETAFARLHFAGQGQRSRLISAPLQGRLKWDCTTP
jgi:enamine deaminase RidA (YjgF/YER057c/UK114 family)